MKRKLAVVMLLACFVFVSLFANRQVADAASNTNGYVAGDIVTFGSYPQTHVTDSTLIGKLESEVRGKTFTNYPYTSYNSAYDTGSSNFMMKRNYDMMSYCDFDYQGAKYRAVKITEYRPPYSWGKPGIDSRQEANGYLKGNTYFFKWEPIEWIVLDPEEGFLLSRYGLDAQAFCEYYKETSYNGPESVLYSGGWAVNYRCATIREWLTVPSFVQNTYKDFNFINAAFSETERQNVINETTLKEEVPNFSTFKDKVFLLSAEEFDQYKSVAGVTTDGKSTDYALAQGSAAGTGSGGFYWTLRAIAYVQNGNYPISTILVARGSGTSYTHTDYAVIWDILSGIRPAMKVDLTSSAIKKAQLDQPEQISAAFDWSTSEWVVSWNRVEGASKYTVYCKKSSDSSWSEIGSSTASTTGTKVTFRYPHRNLSGSSLYYIRVVASSSSGVTSEPSEMTTVYRMARIRFNLNGGMSGAPNDIRGKEGITCVIPSDIPVRTGYVFLGWSSSSTATTATYKGGNSVPLSGDWTLYAVWEKAGPKITSQPADKSLLVGSTAKFAVEATGTAPLTYQWQYRKNANCDWANSGQQGAKTATLLVSTTAGLHGYQFRCVVTDKNGQTVASRAATLTLKPRITTQPVNKSLLVGSTAKFTVVATGKATLTYQWQYRKNASSEWANSGQQGAKTDTLLVSTTAALHGYQFRCIVTDGNGQKTYSSAATLTLKPRITTQPVDKDLLVGSTAKFTLTATGKATLKYQWQYRKNASSEWANSGQTGAKTDTLLVSTTAALHGYQFRCIVTDGNGQQTYSKTVTLTLKPRITTQPVDKSVKAGSTAKFTVAANGKATLTYQWQYRKNASSEWANSGQSGNKTATLSDAAKANLNGYQFRCLVTDGNGRTTASNVVTLKVQ